MILGAADFEGLWQLCRQIDDRHLDQSGRFEGQALFVADGAGGLDYSETGQVRFGAGPAMTAERRYHWGFEPGAVQVRFADGAAFHQFRPEGQGSGTDHPCGEDYYRVQYDFTRWPRWQAVWRVTGPRKDYTMTSVFEHRSRAAGGGG